MKRKKSPYTRKKLSRQQIWTLSLVGGFIVVCLALYFLPPSLKRQAEAACLIECRSRYTIVTTEKDTLRFSPLMVSEGKNYTAYELDSTMLVRLCSGSFISNSGHVVTSAALTAFAPDTLSKEETHALLTENLQALNHLCTYTDKQIEELDYYARTHSVTDEGYTAVMDVGTDIRQRRQQLDSLHHLLSQALQEKAQAVLEADFTIYHQTRADSGKIRSTYGKGLLLAQSDSLMLLQTAEQMLPSAANYFSPSLCSPEWVTSEKWTRRVLGFLSYPPYVKVGHTLLPHVFPSHLPLPALCEGAPVCDVFGRLTGVVVNGKPTNWEQVRHLLYSYQSYWQWAWLRCKTFFKQIFSEDSLRTMLLDEPNSDSPTGIKGYFSTDTLFYHSLQTPSGMFCGRTADNLPHGYGQMQYSDGNSYTGNWNKGRREGLGEWTDSVGRKFLGTWENDSLPHGLCYDSCGVYQGGFNQQLQADGFGTYKGYDGEYYAGDWQKNLRHGFGWGIGNQKIVECGTWKQGKFRGEKMKYTPHRVYGIDISRYQHEMRNNVYGIDWSKLRIKGLGATAEKEVVGETDYPVSFIYIKATQGKTILNKYYDADIAQARKHGIAVGAYHFFSTRVEGEEQADYFIEHAKLQPGDLPPVLDVEPFDYQIQAMGGAKAMFKEILIWLKKVEKHCGRRPLLYVSQHFVNKYMAEAPEEILAHDVWIARYGAFRPYVRLQYWQLSCEGKVDGIQGYVDVNVFNGTQEQFKEYLKEVSIRRIP